MSATNSIGGVAVAAPAKLNLFLHVVGRRADGYHLLDSLIAFGSVHDTVRVAAAGALTLTLDGPFGAALGDAGDDNLVLKAARGLAEASGCAAHAAINLTKRLPVASGIGGGSADAAATLSALMRLWRLELEPDVLARIALSLGADVPVCLGGEAARVSGIGEVIAPVGRLPKAGLLLVNPLLPVATAAVFKARQGAYSAPAPALGGLQTVDALGTVLRGTRNDLEPAAKGLAPAIADVLDSLAKLEGCRLARMSGSGATCFGLFDDEASAQRAARLLAPMRPGWWLAPCRLLSSTRDLVPA